MLSGRGLRASCQFPVRSYRQALDGVAECPPRASGRAAAGRISVRGCRPRDRPERRPDHDRPTSPLGHTEVGRVEDLSRRARSPVGVRLFENAMYSRGAQKLRDVLHHERGRALTSRAREGTVARARDGRSPTPRGSGPRSLDTAVRRSRRPTSGSRVTVLDAWSRATWSPKLRRYVSAASGSTSTAKIGLETARVVEAARHPAAAGEEVDEGVAACGSVSSHRFELKQRFRTTQRAGVTRPLRVGRPDPPPGHCRSLDNARREPAREGLLPCSRRHRAPRALRTREIVEISEEHRVSLKTLEAGNRRETKAACVRRLFLADVHDRTWEACASMVASAE